MAESLIGPARSVAAAAMMTLAVGFVAVGMPGAQATGPSPSESDSLTATPAPSGESSPEGPETASPSPTDDATQPNTESPEPSATSSPTEEPVPSTDPSHGPDSAGEDVPVDNASLYWGISNESHKAAYEPGTYNFLSAGFIGVDSNPDRLAHEVTKRHWKAVEGNVTIQKLSGKTWRTASFADHRTNSSGKSLDLSTSSGLQFKFAAGQGSVNVAGQDATIRWRGRASSIHYSGRSMLRIVDPVLTVTDGVGRLTASVSAVGESRADAELWESHATRTLTLAELPRVKVTAKGFTALPAFAGVKAAAAGQVTDVDGWGAFPASFVGYADGVGLGPFFYSTGGAADRFKAPQPVTVALTNTTPPAPPSSTSDNVEAAAAPENLIKNRPATAPTPPIAPRVAAPLAAPAPVTVQAAAPNLPRAEALVSAGEVPLAAVTPASATRATAWWWSAAGLLLVAAALLAVPLPRRAPARR